MERSQCTALDSQDAQGMADVVSFKKKKRSAAAATATAVGSSSNSEETAASSGFRKRARRRTTDSDDDGNGGEGDDRVDDVLQSIEQVLEDQRLRRELKSIESSSSNGNSNSDKRSTGDSASSVTQYGLHDPKKDGSAGQKLLHLLDGQFTGQSTTTQRDQHEELLYV